VVWIWKPNAVGFGVPDRFGFSGDVGYFAPVGEPFARIPTLSI
jgi:hypothetical protein